MYVSFESILILFFVIFEVKSNTFITEVIEFVIFTYSLKIRLNK